MSIEIEKELFEIIGDNHQMTSSETPLRPDAFIKSDKDKMAVIEKHFRSIMEEIGLDMTDDSLKGTPHRVAKMFIQEIFAGLNPHITNVFAMSLASFTQPFKSGPPGPTGA